MIRRDDSDTVSLLEAARRFGISKSMAYEAAAKGLPLTEGVPVLRFGTRTRPVYRVSKLAIAAQLGERDPPGAALGAVSGADLQEVRSRLTALLAFVDRLAERVERER